MGYLHPLDELIKKRPFPLQPPKETNYRSPASTHPLAALSSPRSLLVGSKPSTKLRDIAALSWNSRNDNRFDLAAADLKSSGGDKAEDDERVEDYESPSERNDHRASARVRASNGEDDPSEEGGTRILKIGSRRKICD